MRLVAAFLTVAFFAPLLPASDFDWLVREFSRESGARQVHVPFLGLARFAVAVSRPAGTTSLNLAIFERGGLTNREFSRLTNEIAGGAWRPIIRVRSVRGECSNIYERSDGKQLKLLIMSLDEREATFVQLRLRPEALIRFVDEHR